MPLLNPLLRALFQSSVLGHTLPSPNYVVLLPTTQSLLYGRDTETNRPYTELITDEDFLGSHVLRITPPTIGTGKETNNVRDGRNKAKTYSTVNGRTVIIKENVVFANKGFKNLTQAQLLNDALYHSPQDGQQWLIYYISKPLVGFFEAVPIVPAVLGAQRKPQDPPSPENATSSIARLPKKKDIKTFGDILMNFPMIARQMQPGLDRLFNEFGKELGKPLPPPPGLDENAQEVVENGSIYRAKSNGSVRLPFQVQGADDSAVDVMRQALETAVTTAIDLFQAVDKQQLSLLGATTELTGPAVERLLESYVVEQVHENLLFPRLCSLCRAQDSDLDRRMKQMECLDVSQVGIEIEDGRRGKLGLLNRLNRGVATFRKMGVSGSPHSMLQVLLETQKAVSESAEPRSNNGNGKDEEKQAATLTVNADVLVSLLLIVVVRAQVRHLHARLSYMQHFIFIDDVDSGEMGYALSTLEAVLTYVSRDAGGLRKAAMRNKSLWESAKTGNIALLRSILEEPDVAILDDAATEEPGNELNLTRSISSLQSQDSDPAQSTLIGDESTTPVSDLSHVFPFQSENSHTPSIGAKKKKRVQMAVRSLSISSTVSMSSRTATIHSALSGIEGDISVQSLAQTQDAQGNSILMMAVENQQVDILRYLLSLSEHFPPDVVIADTTTNGTTLLSAAIQASHSDVIDLVLDFVVNGVDERNFKAYLAQTDERGRSATHYLFNAPELVTRLSSQIPWRLRDKIGQTPLYALCRSYDHPNYAVMVDEALSLAIEAQGDRQPLRLDDHTDTKGNTLLHIVHDTKITTRILHQCDADPNAVNDKRFTPLMLASKYGRLDMVRVLFADPRVDLNIRELRGFTAVELAKDDEVRNRIDDLTLFSNLQDPATPSQNGRITTVVRSFFVDDGSIRVILKSGAPSNPSDPTSTTYTITTCRRSLLEFQNLVGWLNQDHPASYIPSLKSDTFRNAFQIHSRPSRGVLHDTQTSLDRFLSMMLAHPTFGTHESLWEFFLVPDMQPEQMAQRAALKAQILAEKITDDYDSIGDLNEVDSLISHSREMVRKVSTTTRGLIRRGHALHQSSLDVAEAVQLCSSEVSTLGPPSTALPVSHINALARYTTLLQGPPESSPLLAFTKAITSFHSTILAIQTALLRPATQIARIRDGKSQLTRDKQTLNSQSLPRKFQLPGMEESRLRGMQETEKRIVDGEERIERLGKELSYTREVVVGELAGWTEWREKVGLHSIQSFAQAMVVKERERGKGMERMLRTLREGGALSLRGNEKWNGVLEAGEAEVV